MNNTTKNFNTNKYSLGNYIIFGEVPSNMKDKLSKLIENQEIKVNKMINCIKSISSNTIVTRITLPIEFIFLKDELKYIKIANNNFLNRLIFTKNSWEIEDTEQYIYDENGLIDMMPLLPMNELNNFMLDMPVCITIVPHRKTKIETPINYKDLF